MAEEELGFLSRWSRRKRGEEVPPPPPVIAEPPQPVIEVLPEALVACDVPPEPEFDPTSLPPVDTLDSTSDFTAFLKPGVPQALRSAALRKAWTADPLIRDFVNSLDYGWDFNTPGGLPNGFSDTLGVTGEALRKLISQAIGAIEPEEEKPPEVLLAEAPDQPMAGNDEATLDMPPELPAVELAEVPLRLSQAESLPASLPLEEPPPAPRRRHGGALPG